MIILILFAFLAGFVTVLSPCILPVLPIVLSGSIGGGHRKPLGIVTGFILSFTFFTLFLTTIVKATGLSSDFLRTASVVVILLFGVSLLLPSFQVLMEKLFTRLSSFLPTGQRGTGFGAGLLLGLSLGLIWTPCVGPIIASVITLAATSAVNSAAIFITLAYSLGTAIPMLAITYGGRRLLQKVPWLLRSTAKIQKVFGVIMILTALAIFFNLDRGFQSFILTKFPQYGVGLTKIEDNNLVAKALKQLRAPDTNEKDMGKPMNEVSNNNNYPLAPEIFSGGQWFNSAPLTIASLRGKVILVDFWTYSCINCIRTLPYLKSWHEKYEAKGLVVIGVHSPEFEFEKDAKNVQSAIADFELKYPIVQDNNFDTWKAYQNQYWPAKYLIDKYGKVRYTHFGEGEYDTTEAMIQKLLSENGEKVSDKIENADYSVEAVTPELYLGYERVEYLASPEKIEKDKPAVYSLPQDLLLNYFAFTGELSIQAQNINPSQNATLTLHFASKDVYLVMRPAHGVKGMVRVFLDGSLVNGESAGEDVANGVVHVTSDRLYKLIKLEKAGEHTLKLQFMDSNIEAFAFTFG